MSESGYQYPRPLALVLEVSKFSVYGRVGTKVLGTQAMVSGTRRLPTKCTSSSPTTKMSNSRNSVWSELKMAAHEPMPLKVSIVQPTLFPCTTWRWPRTSRPDFMAVTLNENCNTSGVLATMLRVLLIEMTAERPRSMDWW